MIQFRPSSIFAEPTITPEGSILKIQVSIRYPLSDPYLSSPSRPSRARSLGPGQETKKPLKSQRIPRVSANRAGGIRTHDLYHPKVAR